ncbi:MAG: peptidyl-prolyl cis-trans isomerase [Bryobacterales bacterium]|nr:peptidyl-prolyl cis-trans isomerase [Bryobacterales bacterium]
MKILVPILVCAVVACAQEPATRSETLPPGHVVAEVDGKSVTLADLRKILANAPDTINQAVSADPRDFFERYDMLSRLTAEARKAGLDQRSPYKDRLEWQQNTVLMMAMIEERTKTRPVDPAAIEAAYKGNLMRYRVAEVLPIVIPYDNGGGALRTEAASRKRAREVWDKLRAGAPFTATMERESDPKAAEAYKKEHPTILPNSKLPEAVKKAVFATLPGQYTEPLQFGNAFYILQVLSLHVAPVTEVSAMIADELRYAAMERIIKERHDAVQVEVKSPVFFELLGPATPGREAPADLMPETVVASVEGRAYTADQLNEVFGGAPLAVRQAAARQPKEVLIQWALMRQFAKEARESKLDQAPPASDRIRWNDMQTLMQAQIDETMNGISNSAEEVEGYYRDNLKRYQRATVKMIYISYSLVPPPPGSAQKPRNDKEARLRAEEVLTKVKSGTDFTLLVQEYSDDPGTKAKNGEFMPIAASDTRVPENVRKAIFATPAGSVTPPIQQPNGFYLFRVGDLKPIPYGEIRNQLYEEIRQAKFQKWFEKMRGGIQVKVIDGPAIKAEAVHTLPM